MENQVRRGRRAAAVLSLPLGAAGYYTWRIDAMDKAGTLSQPGAALLAPSDWLWILLLGAAAYGTTVFLLPRLARLRLPECAIPSFPVRAGGAILFLCWLPVLLAFYPAAGMNDTVYMMENPLRGSIQFPWAPTLFWGYGAEWAVRVFQSREPFIFAAVLLQMALMAWGLAWTAGKTGELAECPLAGWMIAAYFAFFPMIGNYAAAAVRDPLYSLALLGWMMILWAAAETGRTDSGRVVAASLGLMLLRSNGLAVSLLLFAALARLGRRRIRTGLILLICAVITVLPGKWILSHIGEEPLFQEAAAVPLQQTGRVLIMGGAMDEEMRQLLLSYLPEEQWWTSYSPYTVDFIKWNAAFQHDRMTRTKEAFLAGWARTGLANPRLYAEGWLTETYALWNLDPMEHQVQSRFGWALTDSQTAHMQPADNDRLSAGRLPLPLKGTIAAASFEGSRFLGAGLCLWLTLIGAAVLYTQGRTRLIAVFLPLWANTATLLLSSPASAVFRYSFGYAIALPVIAALLWGRRNS